MATSTIPPDEARLRRVFAVALSKNPMGKHYGVVGIEELKKEYDAAGFSTEVMVVDTVDAHTRFVGVLYPGRSYGFESKSVQRITDRYRELWRKLPFGAVHAFGFKK